MAVTPRLPVGSVHHQHNTLAHPCHPSHQCTPFTLTLFTLALHHVPHLTYLISTSTPPAPPITPRPWVVVGVEKPLLTCLHLVNSLHNHYPAPTTRPLSFLRIMRDCPLIVRPF
ncbi:hypothetical protein E2C01_030924 [Portunus trituberculatus]|uniref:Uncharacterized protein n=1 Tax=Portunus trituberculatus TaxID=210409 RepID=A0A5B7EX56_PORTR|nr:hypothetical protein [Portunus trituberculatus]